MPRRFGLLVNPIAGMGGAVALKGTDDPQAARDRGAEPVSPQRARRFVEAVEAATDDVLWFTVGAPMGENVLEACGVSALAVHAPGRPTTAEDTREAAVAIRDAGVDLLVFVGGDGTAADVADAVGTTVPVLGVPGGVKMVSGVFAETPELAARVALTFDATDDREVMDVDEEAYRRDALVLGLHGVLRVPVHGGVQGGKVPSGDLGVERETLVAAVAERVRADDGITHILGPGTTLAAVKEALGFHGTLLGFDAWRDGEVVVRDAAEADLLAVPLPARIWLTPLGGMGFVLGRGNQQVSAAVLRRVGVANLRVVATPTKLRDLASLHVDTGDPALDAAFPAFLRVRTGRGTERLVPVDERVGGLNEPGAAPHDALEGGEDS